MALYRKLLITGMTQEANDCKTFVLAPVDGDWVEWKAGQFLTLVFEKPLGEERRSYSISSTPALHEPLTITIKRVENGEYSRKLFDNAQVGDPLRTTGISGFFTLPANIESFTEIFFLAAGTGITPIFPLIKTLLYQHPRIRIVLIYSNRSVHTTLFHKKLLELGIQFPERLVTIFLFSSNPNLERARLSKWLLSRLLEEYSGAPFTETLFYTCGPFDYMRMIQITLLAAKVPAQHIKKENFEPLIFESPVRPPDTYKHVVEIFFQGERYELQVQYPQTILQAAKKAGFALPYSCESGSCGSCAATCVLGKVWMASNAVLMDDEINKGRVLTCVGYPVQGDVVLRYDEDGSPGQ